MLRNRNKLHLVLLVCCWFNMQAQESEVNLSADKIFKTEHSIALKSQYLQIKDEFNYGLVFHGFNLGVGYELTKSRSKSMLLYSPDFTFGANFSKGVGLAWHFKPIDLYYGFVVNKDIPRPLFLGAYIATDYNWQLYPELQSGHMFWWSTIELGPKLFYVLPVRSKLLKLSFSTSLLGWTSRPPVSTETLYYSLKFSDFVSNPNSNLSFGTSYEFNHTRLEVEMLCGAEKKLSIAYAFEHFDYYEAPKISQNIHSINLKWKLGKIK